MNKFSINSPENVELVVVASVGSPLRGVSLLRRRLSISEFPAVAENVATLPAIKEAIKRNGVTGDLV